jgi:methionyl-tRNA formyltransferase
MGTPEFATPALKGLISSQKHQVIAAFTGQPKAKDRGMKTKLTPVHELANQHNITVYTPTTLKNKELREAIANLDPDIIVVCAYGFIIPGQILDIPPYGAINIHPSLLPRHRGAAPLQRTITEGDKSTGVCIMQMNAGMDTGDILNSEKFEISERITLAELHDKCSSIGAELLLKTLEDIDNITPQKQPLEGVSYANKLMSREGKIDWQDSAYKLDRKIRGMTPQPGVYSYLEAREIKILSALPLTAPTRDGASDKAEPKPGEIISISPLQVYCGEETILQIEKLQLAGKKAMNAAEFIKGASLKAGDKLG